MEYYKLADAHFLGARMGRDIINNNKQTIPTETRTLYKHEQIEA